MSHTKSGRDWEQVASKQSERASYLYVLCMHAVTSYSNSGKQNMQLPVYLTTTNPF